MQNTRKMYIQDKLGYANLIKNRNPRTINGTVNWVQTAAHKVDQS